MQATTELKRHESPYDYTADREQLKRFFLFFRRNGEYKYLSQLRSLEEKIDVDLDDVRMYDQTGLASRMVENAWSYTRQLVKVVDELLYSEEVGDGPVDVFYNQRIARFKEKYPEKNILEYFPSSILRNYMVNIRPGVQSAQREVLAIRDVGAEDVGKLISVRGVVTRVSVVKPAARVATYICEGCGCETYQEINNDAFDMLEECGSEKCRTRNVRGTLTLLTRGSRFVRRQNVVLQELTSDVPHGSIPRLMKIEMNGALTGQVGPGEVAVISGIFLPKPYYGLRKLKAGLLNDTYLECTAVNMNKGELVEEDVDKTADKSEGKCNFKVSFSNGNFVFSSFVISSERIMDILVNSFAPEIYGMREVKKILLLMLAGAPTEI
ncbi:DNA replication licensing factor MCM7 [Pancytospora epiphaga]|nr:DNA replication licensing factor MCM7 [Pancytospora epiphaga]